MRKLLAADRGFSLVEIAVAAGLTVAALAIVSSFLVSAQRTVSIEQSRSTANDEARTAMEQVDREVRSANFILPLDPYTLLVETQSNAHSPFKCVHWVIDEQQLLRRDWPSSHPEDVSGWRVVADHVVNQELGLPLFELPDTALNRVETGGRNVEVTIYVNGDLENAPDATTVVRQALTGRNINAGAVAAGLTWPPTEPPDPCKVLP